MAVIPSFSHDDSVGFSQQKNLKENLFDAKASRILRIPSHIAFFASGLGHTRFALAYSESS